MNEGRTANIAPTKVPFYPLNLIYFDQILVGTNTVKFLGLQFDSHLMWKTQTFYEVECCVVYHEKTISYTKHRYTEDCIFC